MYNKVIFNKISIEKFKRLLQQLWEKMDGKNVLPLIVVGKPGLGKARIVVDFAKQRNIPIFVGSPALLDTLGFVQRKFQIFKEQRGIILLDEFLHLEMESLFNFFYFLLKMKVIEDYPLRTDTLIVATGSSREVDKWVLNLPLDMLICLEIEI